VLNRNPEWFNDVEFWEEFAPIMFDDDHWAEVPEVVDGITRLSRLKPYNEVTSPLLKPAAKILDLCCGFGRISIELARRGYAVTGVDITKPYLDAAKEDASCENLNIEYVHTDAREFTRPEYFDTVVNLYTSIGYFADPKDEQLLFSNVYKSLKSGGSFIIETLGKEIAVLNFVETEWFERAGYTVLTEYEVLDSWTFLNNRWIIFNDEKRIEKTFPQRLYAASELRELLFKAGFGKVEIYGDWNENPYDHKAQRLIVVGRK
jgi:SAM-dependent methyltransferase